MTSENTGCCRRSLVAGILTTGMLGLTGCGIQEGAEKIVKVILDPSIPVGEPGDQPSRLDISLLGAQSMNPNADGSSTPLSIKIFALTSDHLFYEYDFISLLIDPEAILGPTLIKVLDEVQVVPGGYKVIRDYEVPEGTRNIGFAALFTTYEDAVWRASIPVTDTGQRENILVSASGLRLTVKKEE